MGTLDPCQECQCRCHYANQLAPISALFLPVRSRRSYGYDFFAGFRNSTKLGTIWLPYWQSRWHS